MIRAKELGGRAVVDVDAAEKLGRIDRIVLDPESRRVAGFVVSSGSSIFNNGKDLLLPASCVHAVGPDAVTVHRSDAADADASLEGLPRVSDITGRKVVSDTGRMLGTVDDVLIDERDGRIIGYALDGPGVESTLQTLVKGDRHETRRGAFLRAEANLRTGENLIVAPEDAVSYDWPADQATVAHSPLPGAAPWTGATMVSSDTSAQWVRSSPPLPTLDKTEGH